MSTPDSHHSAVTMEPFRIAVPESEVDDLRRRLRDARWPAQGPGSGWTYGADLSAMRGLAEYWADGYDWRRHEAELNEIPQLMASVDGQHFHVLHARSREPNALPLVITHGWPGSIAEFRHMI